jgi:segregation and condensation protein B
MSDPLELGKAAASRIGAGEWQLDAEPAALVPEPELPPEPPPPPPPRTSIIPKPSETPPNAEQIVEAMLFVGGPPLTHAVAGAAVRGLTADRFQVAIDGLNKKYRDQNRPYSIQSRDGGYVLAVSPKHRGLRERLFGGPREARLSAPAIDVLAVVAYRQPVGKAEIDAVRGTDSGGTLRLLVRLGLVAVQHRAEAGTREVRYGTTPRFLQTFNLTSLDELPRLGETQAV